VALGRGMTCDVSVCFVFLPLVGSDRRLNATVSVPEVPARPRRFAFGTLPVSVEFLPAASEKLCRACRPAAVVSLRSNFRVLSCLASFRSSSIRACLVAARPAFSFLTLVDFTSLDFRALVDFETFRVDAEFDLLLALDLEAFDAELSAVAVLAESPLADA
jgi:hypothetical protein